MNKLALLAFAILLFLSTMLWYLANGSLNEYLKSQVLLQSHYYSGQKAQLLSADFSNNTGITHFTDLSIANIEGLTQPQLIKVDNISVHLAELATSQFDAPSIAKKTTTLVHVKQLRFNKLHAWSEVTQTGQTNLEVLYKKVEIQLATDYPALYPQLSAELYAKMYPERSEKLALENIDSRPKTPEIETNQAIIASKKAKQKKRLLGKAQTRVSVSSVLIEELTLTMIKDNKVLTKRFDNIELGRLGDENGLDSNQLGGELLRRLLGELIRIEKDNSMTSLANELEQQ
ncbi:MULTISPECIES: hypothetical protein [Colwellia]|uniref:Uncharacterized protein n=1 Tax=Colwellia marinimaniae TaxID=1513592 RepID=A0ABQ0MUD0_9GAMM|nr:MULTISPECIES: hypothetical protein [Colwellia]GAW95961.1 hypothetical protein MTCD1_01567 [Colwellia marinimaniae]